jgi:hypothetical protein
MNISPFGIRIIDIILIILLCDAWESREGGRL